MKYVLGIDAAWTVKKPSGVALLELRPEGRPRLIHAAGSYGEFLEWKVIDWTNRARGTPPDMASLLSKCRTHGYPVSVVALDIPLSSRPITGRRTADNMVSREYGARKASTHSPNASRPGQVSVDIVSQLVRSGYNLACVNNNEEHSFIEVYPHIAIIEFFGLEERLEYKVSNHRRYWPELSSEESREKVISNLLDLERRLAGRVSSLRNIIPELVADSQRGLSHLKKFEDVMDAIVCALVGTSYIMGEAYPLGDDVGAIWVPRH